MKYPLTKRSGECRDSTDGYVDQVSVVRHLDSIVPALADHLGGMAASAAICATWNDDRRATKQVLASDSTVSRFLRAGMCNKRTADRRENGEDDVSNRTDMSNALLTTNISQDVKAIDK